MRTIKKVVSGMNRRENFYFSDHFSIGGDAGGEPIHNSAHVHQYREKSILAIINLLITYTPAPPQNLGDATAS